MKKTSNKIALIGAGMVGMSFVYSAVNQGIAEEYILIDGFPGPAEGNAMDIEDATSFMPRPIRSIKAGEYKDLKDVDLIVITAGRPQKDGETRLQMIDDNIKIMAGIAANVKKSGFDGVTIIASNPVDIMTYAYQQITKFPAAKVISSGTSLDSSRLQIALANKLNVAAASVNAYVLGEHGDSSVSAFSAATIGGEPLSTFKIPQAELDKIHEGVYKKAYEIISRKRATYYGIGAALMTLSKAVLRDEKRIVACSALLNGEYGHKDVYAGTPAVLGKGGIERIVQIAMSPAEKAQFDKSVNTLKENMANAKKVLETVK